jgi:hypothetical protein
MLQIYCNNKFISKGCYILRLDMSGFKQFPFRHRAAMVKSVIPFGFFSSSFLYPCRFPSFRPLFLCLLLSQGSLALCNRLYYFLETLSGLIPFIDPQ